MDYDKLKSKLVFNYLVADTKNIAEKEQQSDDEQFKDRKVLFTYTVNRKVSTMELVMIKTGILMRSINAQAILIEKNDKVELCVMTDDNLHKDVNDTMIDYYLLMSSTDDNEAKFEFVKEEKQLSLTINNKAKILELLYTTEAPKAASLALMLFQDVIDIDNANKKKSDALINQFDKVSIE